MQAMQSCKTRTGFLCPNFRYYSILAFAFILFLGGYQSNAVYGQDNTIIDVEDIQPRLAGTIPTVSPQTKDALPTHLPYKRPQVKWYDIFWENIWKWLAALGR